MANSHNVQPTEYKRTRNQKIIFKKKRQAHCAQISPSLVDFIAPCIQKGVRVQWEIWVQATSTGVTDDATLCKTKFTYLSNIF